jgi:ATP-dependent RNA helicase DeaD
MGNRPDWPKTGPKGQPLTTFTDLGLEEKILQGIHDLGFEFPTDIQQETIPSILNSDQDMICLAQTGSGKTAAFGLPILQRLRFEKDIPQGLILAPTRELAIQITTEMQKYAKYLPALNMTCVYGGSSYGAQKAALRDKPQLVVATPGRLLDLADRGTIDLSAVEYLVLDEADTMLNMGFREELDKIIDLLPAEKRVLLFSATMPDWINNLAQSTLRDPKEISVGEKNSGAQSVEHRYYMVQARDKEEALTRLLDFHPDIYGIVFVRTRISAKSVAEHLSKAGYNADALHGDLSQDQREYVTRRFREGSVRVLVATDIAARGLDVKDLTHVIHFDLPDEAESYTHRSGRTGRAGATGHSLALINLREKGKIKRLERSLKLPIKKDQIPAGDAITQAQVLSRVQKLQQSSEDVSETEALYRMVSTELQEISKEELIKRWINHEFQSLLNSYSGAKDLNPQIQDQKFRQDTPGKGRRDSRDRNDSDMVWLTINLGRADNFLPPDLLQLLGRTFPRKRVEVGAIKIGDESSSFQVYPGDALMIEEGIKRKKAYNKRLKVKIKQSGYDRGFSGPRGGGSRSKNSRPNQGNWKSKSTGRGPHNGPGKGFSKKKDR